MRQLKIRKSEKSTNVAQMTLNFHDAAEAAFVLTGFLPAFFS